MTLTAVKPDFDHLFTTGPDFDHLFTNVLCLEHIFLKKAHKCFHKLRETRLKIITGEIYGAEAKCASLFADTQAGKTKIVTSYVNGPVVDYCYEIGLFPRDTKRGVVARLQRKVIYVEVSGTATLASLLEDLLRAFGDPRPEKGNLGQKKQRILTYIREFETELLIFDEMNHLKIGAASKTMHTEATRVHNVLKDFLLGGCPIVFTGTSEAEKKVFSDLQIRARCSDRLFLGPLVSGNELHYESYRQYCGLLGLEIKKLGIFPERSNFMNSQTVAALFMASGGYYGHTTNLVAIATRFAYEAGAAKVEWRHLAAAADEYTMFNKLCTYNPFHRMKEKGPDAQRKEAGAGGADDQVLADA